MADSPGSPLSSIASDMSDHDDLKPDITTNQDHASPSVSSIMPPSKRRRTNTALTTGGATAATTTTFDHPTPGGSSHQEDNPPTSPSSTISSDTSGDIPNSPSIQALLGGGQDDDYSGHGGDQVTVCRWTDCDANDLGNMDALVRHIHEQHIANREKRFVCEWSGCPRNGQPHASGYALRAHMRSHTREKPFYCSLPECDRSFTRSDALAKHMRTVHETESLRPSDPVPKHQQQQQQQQQPGTPAHKVQRIKLKLSQPKEETDPHSHPDHQHHPQQQPLITTTATNPDEPAELLEYSLPEFFGSEIGFDEHELSLPPRELYRLLRRQIHWAQKEGEQLRDEWERIRPKRKQAWMEKEAIFDDFMDAEVRLLRQLDALVGHESVAVGGAGPGQYGPGKTQPQQLPGQQEQENQHQHQQGQKQEEEHGQGQEQEHGQDHEQDRQESVDMKPPVESASVQS